VSISPRPPAERLLAALVTEFGASIPDRHYLAPGPNAAWDGEHLAVSIVQVLPGSSDASSRAGGFPSHQAGSMQIPRVVMEARILRCIPALDSSGRPPTAAGIQTAAAGLMDDLGLLLDGAYRFLKDSQQSVATIGQADPLGPEGGLGGYRVVVTYAMVD
jgi:hypothetical protein